jgi:RNA polymerase sigma-70 factor, ECF subfamily
MTDLEPSPETRTVEAAPSIEVLFRQEYSYVFHTLRRLGVHERDLEDVAQEVFLTVHAILDDYDRGRPLKPWLFGIAYRHALRYREKARHRRERIDSSPGSDAVAPQGTEENVAVREARAVVLAALESVEDHRRAVFVMTEIDGFTAPEIAEALGIPLNTVYSRLRLARAEFERGARRIAGREGQP